MEPFNTKRSRMIMSVLPGPVCATSQSQPCREASAFWILDRSSLARHRFSRRILSAAMGTRGPCLGRTTQDILLGQQVIFLHDDSPLDFRRHGEAPCRRLIGAHGA
eukprot:7243643-Pyramimonas_sp.AAC.1